MPVNKGDLPVYVHIEEVQYDGKHDECDRHRARHALNPPIRRSFVPNTARDGVSFCPASRRYWVAA